MASTTGDDPECVKLQKMNPAPAELVTQIQPSHFNKLHIPMFNPPCKLDHLTELFQSLCDAAMDLDPKVLVGKIPESLIERAHLAVLVDVSVVRECASVAEQLSNAEPYQIVDMVVTHHRKITHYLFIRSMILDGDPENESDDLDLNIF